MKICGDTEEIWGFICFLYHVADEAVGEHQEEVGKLLFLQSRLEKGRRKEQLLEALYISQKEYAEKEAEFLAAVSKTVHSLNQYLTFLEELTFQQEYEKYLEQCRENLRDGKESFSYQKIHFRGTDFYIREDNFDLEYKDATGKTNLERMKRGCAPVGKDGMYVNLHHLIQKESGGIVEIQKAVHKRGHKILHINPSSIPSGINRKAFAVLRRNYWKWRAEFEEKRKNNIER